MSSCAVSIAVPFTRTTVLLPVIMNISDTRPSATILRSASSRLLPRQSGSHSVRSSTIRTTGPSSPLGVASVPSGPTVDRMQNRDAPIQRR
jgi:hypothetical protein